MEREALLLEEYKEVNNNMRHFSNMRVAVLTISLAVNGVLVQSVFQQKNTFILIGLFLIGMVSTLVFLIFENRVTFYYSFYHLRARELESILQLNQYRRPVKKKFLNATNATKFLYYVIALFWFILLLYKFL